MTDPRVSVGVGTFARFHFEKLQAHLVSLAGAVPKAEAVQTLLGTITSIQDDGTKLVLNGKPDFLLTIQPHPQGSPIEVRRSNVKFCEVVSG